MKDEMMEKCREIAAKIMDRIANEPYNDEIKTEVEIAKALYEKEKQIKAIEAHLFTCQGMLLEDQKKLAWVEDKFNKLQAHHAEVYSNYKTAGEMLVPTAWANESLRKQVKELEEKLFHAIEFGKTSQKNNDYWIEECRRYQAALERIISECCDDLTRKTAREALRDR